MSEAAAHQYKSMHMHEPRLCWFPTLTISPLPIFIHSFPLFIPYFNPLYCNKMEPVSFALTVAGLMTAIKGTVDTALLIDAYFDENQSSCHGVALKYHIVTTKLKIWADQYGIEDKPRNAFNRQPKDLQKIIIYTLARIKDLNGWARTLVEKHQVRMPEMESENNVQMEGERITALSRKRVKPRSKFRWLIKSKAEFEHIVSELQQLVENLQSLSCDPSGERLLSDALPQRVLAAVHDPILLERLAIHKDHQNSRMSLVARIKFIQKRPSSITPDLPRMLGRDQIKFISGTSNIAVLSCFPEHRPYVWIEWNEFTAGPGSNSYFDRIISLGKFLQEVSEPLLRLPPCYGLFYDTDYQATHGKSRVGYIFGLPRTFPTVEALALPHYEENLARYQLSNLTFLLNEPVKGTLGPPLGDRFALAYSLASAFSLFHAAGWLHKGFHSDNISFFSRKDNLGVTVTEPFITGFQYSRLQDEGSLSYGPLENKELEYYYHPQADKGFSKQRDLYGLGVVLLEIGSWETMSKRVSESKKQTLTSRIAWQQYLLKMVNRELGFMMGEQYQQVVRVLLSSELPSDEEGGTDDELFAISFKDKILQPLSLCKV